MDDEERKVYFVPVAPLEEKQLIQHDIMRLIMWRETHARFLQNKPLGATVGIEMSDLCY